MLLVSCFAREERHEKNFKKFAMLRMETEQKSKFCCIFLLLSLTIQIFSSTSKIQYPAVGAQRQPLFYAAIAQSGRAAVL